MGIDCKWIADNIGEASPSTYGCVWLEKHWSDATKSAPYPCTASEMYFESQKLAVTPKGSTKEAYWGTDVSDMQTGITVTGDKITGTLKFLNSGQLVTDWGEGNFIALEFTVPDGATSCKVGLVPSESGMSLQELDEDKDGVFKITNKATQKLVIETRKGAYFLRQEFDLSGLTCQSE